MPRRLGAESRSTPVLKSFFGRSLLLKIACVCTGFSLASALGHAQTASKDSPFLPPSSATPTAQANNAGYALTGMTVVGKDTLLSITNQTDKRSVWILVGKTVGDITAVSYDAATEKAVIRAGGQNHTLVLKKGAVLPGPVAPLSQPSPQTAIAAPQPPPAVEVPPGNLSPQEEKEMEARMLVTDLLEIGQQQRKAYAEAQRQAAAKGVVQTPPAAAKQTAPAPSAASAPKK